MKLLSYILSPFFGFISILLLFVFHPLQWVAFYVFGENALKKTSDVLLFFLFKALLLIGVRVSFNQLHNLPEDKTLILVMNHQGFFDIPIISWYFRKHQPKFVAKKELGSGTPSISFSLKKSGAALIDRKNAKQAIVEMSKYSKRIHDKKWAAAIFPEGTRSKDGKALPFHVNGLKMIIKHNPEAHIVPITINNSWKVFKYGIFPFGLGSPINVKVHQPVAVNSKPFELLVTQVEKTIVADLYKS